MPIHYPVSRVLLRVAAACLRVAVPRLSVSRRRLFGLPAVSLYGAFCSVYAQ